MQEMIQLFLMRLYTEASTRKRFFADRHAFYMAEKIYNKEVIEFLNGLNTEQISAFSESLLMKRAAAIKKLIPGTVIFLKDNFKNEFRQFAEQYHPSGMHLHHEDALAFIDFLVGRDIGTQEVQRSLLKYEKTLLENFTSEKKWRLTKHSFSFPEHYHKLLKNGTYLLPRKNTLILWKRGLIFSKISFF